MRPIPFRAALFDLDGTLLDSMYVWTKVDEVFFAARNLPVPADYGRAIAGLSYQETAEYTVKHYCPNEKWQDIVAEWTRLSEIEYSEHVRLKPGSLSYLRMLKRSGVKLAVTTALPPNLYEPCLEHLGVLELFDTLCSTDHTDGKGKASGQVYLLAAQQLGVQAQDCAVFEDVLAGIQGAKNVGMQAYCIRDRHSAKDFDAIAAIADGMMDILDEMSHVHDFLPSPRCVIFTAHCEGDPDYHAEANDLILCADGGWKLAETLCVHPDLIIGDFDSSEKPDVDNVEIFPVLKDDTDTMLCLKHGLKHGYENFLILGGFGGRLDHTIANLQTLAYAAEHGAQVTMQDGHCRAVILRGGKITVKRRPGKLSIFALTDRCSGIDMRGALYELTDATLTNSFPLGVSNEYRQDTVDIAVREGTLLIVQTDD